LVHDAKEGCFFDDLFASSAPLGFGSDSVSRSIAELCVAKIWLHEHSGSANQNAPMWQVHEISWGVDEMTNMTVGQSLTSCKS
jgi:hypothetical protein